MKESPLILNNFGYYRNKSEYAEYKRLEKALTDKKTIYVKFTNWQRKDSIAKVISYEVTNKGSSEYLSIALGWDGRKNQVNISYADYTYGLKWLEDYTGPTNYVFLKSSSKPKPAVIPPKPDTFDTEPKVGDLISYIFRKYKTLEIRYGKIEKITNTGAIHARSFKVNESGVNGTLDKVYQSYYKDKGNSFTIITKDFLDKLILARLSA